MFQIPVISIHCQLVVNILEQTMDTDYLKHVFEFKCLNLFTYLVN